MSDLQGKIWGKTAEVSRNQNSSVHYLEIKKGGYCSEHRHENKTNFFYCISGELKILIYRDKITDSTILTSGKEMEVPSGVYHKFVALTDVKCIEIYRPVVMDEDIQRRTIGGINE